MTYKIIAKTNGYIANRDIMFNGKTEVLIEKDLSLKEAQKKLLDMFNEDYDTYFTNWGLVRCHYPLNSSSFNDGTRGYEWDSRNFGIVKEEEDEI